MTRLCAWCENPIPGHGERVTRSRYPLSAQLGGVLASAIHVAIYRVIDYFDLLIDIEDAHRTIAEIIGNGSDAVALVDGVARDGQVGSVQPDQSDISAVQRSRSEERRGG